MKKIRKESGIKFRVGKYNTEALVYNNAPVPVNMKGKSKTFIYAKSEVLTRELEKESAIREICDNNFSVGSMSIILRLPDTKELRNVDTMRYEVKKFIGKINKRYENFMYIATIETRENGEPYCLMLCNLESNVREEELCEIWHGHLGKYTVNSMKYFTEIKENLVATSIHHSGKKKYICSKNVKRDIIVDFEHPEHEYLLNEFTRELADGKHEFMGFNQILFGVAVDQKNLKTGKVTTELLLNQKLTEKLKNEGYYYFVYTFNIYSMRESFPEKFHITTAKPRGKYST